MGDGRSATPGQDDETPGVAARSGGHSEGIAVADLATLEAVRDRLVAVGADIGEIQKLGGEWSLFLKNLGMVLAVVIVGVVLASLIYTWLSTVNISPSVTFGG